MTTNNPNETPLEQIAAELAKEIYHNATNSRAELERLLMEFAREIISERLSNHD